MSTFLYEDMFAAEVSQEFYFFYCDKAGILLEIKGANTVLVCPCHCVVS